MLKSAPIYVRKESSELTKGKFKSRTLASYYDSVLFDTDSRTAWYNGMPFGTSYAGAVRAETFNDYEGNSPLGAYSLAAGYGTYAPGYASAAFGRFNDPMHEPERGTTYDTIFSVGIGADADHRENALDIRADGSAYLFHNLYSYMTYSLNRIDECGECSYYDENGMHAGELSYRPAVSFNDFYNGMTSHAEYPVPKLGLRYELKHPLYSLPGTESYMTGTHTMAVPKLMDGIEAHIYGATGNVCCEGGLPFYGNTLGCATEADVILSCASEEIEFSGDQTAYDASDLVPVNGIYWRAFPEGESFAYIINGYAENDGEISPHHICRYLPPVTVVNPDSEIRLSFAYCGTRSQMYVPELKARGVYVHDSALKDAASIGEDAVLEVEARDWLLHDGKVIYYDEKGEASFRVSGDEFSSVRSFTIASSCGVRSVSFTDAATGVRCDNLNETVLEMIPMSVGEWSAWECRMHPAGMLASGTVTVVREES